MQIGIDTRLLTDCDGGIRRYLSNLVATLPELGDGHRYVLHGGKPRSPLAANVEWRPASGLRRGLAHLHIPGREDLFHATNYFPPLFEPRPTVVTVHDLAIRRLPQHHPLQRRLRHRLLPSICRRAARIIAVSNTTRVDLIHFHGIDPDKIDVIPLAVGDSFHPGSSLLEQERVRARYRLPGEFILFVGSIQPRKNLAVLIDAVAALGRGMARVPLVIAGGGSSAEVAALCRRAAEHGLERGRELILPGVIDDVDLPALYAMSRMFVYPSLWEGFGLPPLEAMACGAPVVLPRHSSLEEFYSECSAQYDASTPNALRDALAELLESPGRCAELIEKGTKYARTRSWEQVATETVATYRRALVGH